MGLGQIQTSDKEQFLIIPIRACANIEVCVFSTYAHGCISVQCISMQRCNFNAFQGKKHRLLHRRFVGLRPEFCRSAALSKATALLHLAGEQLFPGPFPPFQQSSWARDIHRRGGRAAIPSPLPCPPRSETASSPRCKIWHLPGTWILGTLPGCGAAGGEHDLGLSRRVLLPKGKCEMLEGAWVRQQVKSFVELEGLKYLFLHYCSEE